MRIIRTPKITHPGIKINDLSALNKRLSVDNEQNQIKKMNQMKGKHTVQVVEALPELRPSILSASEGKSFAFVSEKSSISTKSTIIG